MRLINQKQKLKGIFLTPAKLSTVLIKITSLPITFETEHTFYQKQQFDLLTNQRPSLALEPFGEALTSINGLF